MTPVRFILEPKYTPLARTLPYEPKASHPSNRKHIISPHQRPENSVATGCTLGSNGSDVSFCNHAVGMCLFVVFLASIAAPSASSIFTSADRPSPRCGSRLSCIRKRKNAYGQTGIWCMRAADRRKDGESGSSGRT